MGWRRWKNLIVGIAALSPIQASAAFGPDYGDFHNPRPVTTIGYDGDLMEPFISKDGRYLFFNNRNEPPERTDLYYAQRIDDVTFKFQGPLTGANSRALDGVASLDEAGNFYFVSTRSYGGSLSTIYRGHFDAGALSRVKIVAGLSPLIPGIVDFDGEISADGQTLYFSEGDFRGDGPKPQQVRLHVAKKVGEAFVRDRVGEWQVAAIQTGGVVYAPSISADGLELFVTGVKAIEPGMTPQIYRATRTGPDAAFGPLQRVTAASGFVEAPSLSADGRRLYFHRKEGNRLRLYEAERASGHLAR